MRFVIVAIRDRAADVYSTPSFVHTVGAAIRSFSDAINDSSTAVSKHPEDYDLFVLGEFDDNSGAFVADSPRQIAVGKDLVR